MINLYERNGLPFWTEEQIEVRAMLAQRLCRVLFDALREENRAFSFHQVEAPILTPSSLVNRQYVADVFKAGIDTTLRPETTVGSYAYARHLLGSKAKRLPIVVWQHGKSFRNEQDQVTKNIRLKEFYQLEFQILYAETTMNDYSEKVKVALVGEMSRLLGPCYFHPSERLPGYSLRTDDIMLIRNHMELCSISHRTDFDRAKNLEVAIGTDRCVVAYLERK